MASRLAAWSLAVVCLALVASCGAPTPPPGEQYFADAKKNLAAMDYDAALNNLERTVRAAEGTPHGQQGLLLRVVLLTALADTAKRMGEAYRIGARQPPARARTGQFGKMGSDYYGIARVRLMNAMEDFMKQRGKLGEQPLELQVDFPDFTGSEHAALNKIREGYWVEDNDRYRAQLETTRNALARLLARVAGTGDDLHKAHAAFAQGTVRMDSRLYLIELSETFLKLAEMFGSRAMDDPRHQRICAEVVRDNLNLAHKLLAARPDKDLEGRMKKLRGECEKLLKSLAA